MDLNTLKWYFFVLALPTTMIIPMLQLWFRQGHHQVCTLHIGWYMHNIHNMYDTHIYSIHESYHIYLIYMPYITLSTNINNIYVIFVLYVIYIVIPRRNSTSWKIAQNPPNEMGLNSTADILVYIYTVIANDVPTDTN